MKTALALVLLMIAAPVHAQYFHKSTDQFGFVGVDIGPEFRLSAMCTVSNGEIDKMATYVDWIPNIGDALAKAMDITALDKGASVCGLRHTRKKGASIRAAKSAGFDLMIKTYAAGTQIGSDSPKLACKKLNVNISSLCFEFVKVKENTQSQQADGVTACIDVHATGTTPAKSLVLGAGNIPQAIKDAMADAQLATQDAPCASRNF